MTHIPQPPLSRRRFLQDTSVAALCSAFALDRLAGAAPARHAIGMQLYTMQSLLVKDFNGTFEALGKIGYREVEPVGLLGHDAKSYRAALDAAGLKAPSAHVLSAKAQAMFVEMATGRVPVNDAWDQINASMELSHIEQIMEDMLAQSEVLGNKYLVLAAAGDAKLFESRAGIEKVIAAFRKAGDLCQQKGLQFGWHPHLAEYQVVEGKRAIDWVLEATDPKRVLVELDFFWAAMAGADIPALLSRYSGRFHLGHVKDMAKNLVVPPGGFKDLDKVPDDSYEDVGYGKLDYRSWIPLARRAGMRHFFVERDNAPQPLENAKRSYGALKGLI
jgi:sugar phosphate isomerase/epimerase